MKLYCSGNSPYARKVRVVALELGLANDLQLIDSNPRELTSEVRVHNPLAKIPVLLTDSGLAILDSPVICEYLNETFGGGKLLPEGPHEAWRARSLTALSDGVLDAGMAVRQEVLRTETERSSQWVDKQTAIVARGFASFAAQLGHYEHSVSLASIAIGCTIGWTLYRHPGHDWLAQYPALATWLAEFMERDSMRLTAPGPLKTN